jgi:hypothetical protein
VVAEFRDSKLSTEHPGSSDHLEYISRHTRRQVDGAEVVFDADMSDIRGIQSDFVDDCSDDIPGFDSMNSANFDTERFVRAMLRVRSSSITSITAFEAWCSFVSVRSLVSSLAIQESIRKFMDEEGLIAVHHRC